MDPSFDWFSFRKTFMNEAAPKSRVLFEIDAAARLQGVYGLTREESTSLMGQKLEVVRERYPDVRIATLTDSAWNDALEKTYQCENISDQFRSLSDSLPVAFQVSPFLSWMQDRWLKILPLQVQVVFDLREGDEVRLQAALHFDRGRLTFFQEGADAGIDDGVRRAEIRISGRQSAFDEIRRGLNVVESKRIFKNALKADTLRLSGEKIWTRLMIRYFI